MMTSAECLEKAVQMEAQSLQSDTEKGREAYANLARSWRRIAALVRKRETRAP